MELKLFTNGQHIHTILAKPDTDLQHECEKALSNLYDGIVYVDGIEGETVKYRHHGENEIKKATLIREK
jgi:hypothetical protein